MAFPLVTTAARQARVLEVAGHRPWPVPGWPWSVAQTLVDAVSCHWRVVPEALAPYLPAGVEPDLHGGQAWLTIAALRVTGLRLRGMLAVPRLSDGAELAVRAAVSVADRPAARARIRIARTGVAVRVEASRTRPGGAPAVFHAGFEATGPAAAAAPGSLEAFLHERYLLVAGRPDGGLVLAEQHRPPWRLAPAQARVELETIAPPGLARGVPALAHIAEPLDQLVWAPERQEA